MILDCKTVDYLSKSAFQGARALTVRFYLTPDLSFDPTRAHPRVRVPNLREK